MAVNKLTIWNEFIHENKNPAVKSIYPDGIHNCIAAHFQSRPDITVQTATLDQPQHGLTKKVLNNTDVLIWWGHIAHDQVDDKIVDRVQQRVLDGMGLICLHSAHLSKIFRRLMGTTCNLRWREANEKERLWIVNPYHPITEGLGNYIELPGEEMYGEYFDIPEPDALLFISWFEGGEVFRSGAVWHRGKGKVFYFRPGHESYPVYHNPEIMKVIENAVYWSRFAGNSQVQNTCLNPEPLEKIDGSSTVS